MEGNKQNLKKMKNIKTSKIIAQEKIASSITISPVTGGYLIRYHLRETTKKGKCKIKNIVVENVIEDVVLPSISVNNVKHLGYISYQYLAPNENNFYINFYK